ASPTHMKQHAHDHRKGGPDEITPEMIGAMAGDEIDDNPADLTYYVRANGNDDNDGLSEATAFRTFGKAMSMWKRFTFGGKRTFNIGSGVDLTPDLTPNHREWKVEYKWGGEFVFDFNNAHELVPQFEHIRCKVRIQNFTRFHSGIFDGLTVGEWCSFENCLFVDVNNVKVDFTKVSPEGYSANTPAFNFTQTRGRVGEATITKVRTMLHAGEFSFVFVYNPKGTVRESSDIPFNAYNGAIIDCLLYGITGATTKFQVDRGGQVFGIT
ncbi:hypothetical protein KHA94_00285, partial [Bacillus sp. FJAT-49705]